MFREKKKTIVCKKFLNVNLKVGGCVAYPKRKRWKGELMGLRRMWKKWV